VLETEVRRMRILPRRSKIAVVDLMGTIERGKGTQNLITTINGLRDNKKIKAVVINIDCAGGDAAASNSVYLAMNKLANKKPVIAFIGGLAVSGGYMVIMPATKIVAIPGSFVGSIGVVTASMHAEELLDAVGVYFSVAKSAPMKDMGSFYRAMTEEEKAKEQACVDSFNDYFVSLVAKGRNMEEAKTRELATGEFFLSEKAKDLGLIDELGDLEDTIDMALDLGKVKKRRVQHITPKKGLLQRWLLGASAPMSEQIAAEAENILVRRIPALRSRDYRLRL
jgi:protease-4